MSKTSIKFFAWIPVFILSISLFSITAHSEAEEIDRKSVPLQDIIDPDLLPMLTKEDVRKAKPSSDSADVDSLVARLKVIIAYLNEKYKRNLNDAQIQDLSQKLAALILSLDPNKPEEELLMTILKELSSLFGISMEDGLKKSVESMLKENLSGIVDATDGPLNIGDVDYPYPLEKRDRKKTTYSKKAIGVIKGVFVGYDAVKGETIKAAQSKLVTSVILSNVGRKAVITYTAENIESKAKTLLNRSIILLPMGYGQHQWTWSKELLGAGKYRLIIHVELFDKKGKSIGSVQRYWGRIKATETQRYIVSVE